MVDNYLVLSSLNIKYGLESNHGDIIHSFALTDAIMDNKTDIMRYV
jgi:hypothetical protein